MRRQRPLPRGFYGLQSIVRQDGGGLVQRKVPESVCLSSLLDTYYDEGTIVASMMPVLSTGNDGTIAATGTTPHTATILLFPCTPSDFTGTIAAHRPYSPGTTDGLHMPSDTIE